MPFPGCLSALAFTRPGCCPAGPGGGGRCCPTPPWRGLLHRPAATPSLEQQACDDLHSRMQVLPRAGSCRPRAGGSATPWWWPPPTKSSPWPREGPSRPLPPLHTQGSLNGLVRRRGGGHGTHRASLPHGLARGAGGGAVHEGAARGGGQGSRQGGQPRPQQPDEWRGAAAAVEGPVGGAAVVASVPGVCVWWGRPGHSSALQKGWRGLPCPAHAHPRAQGPSRLPLALAGTACAFGSPSSRSRTAAHHHANQHVA